MQSLASRCFFVLVVMFGSLTLPAYGDTVYTYTGNSFDTWAPGFSCPNVCNVTGSFTLSSPLAPNLPDGTVVVPIAATLFSSGVTLTLADVDVNDFSQFTLAISTDALGNITGGPFSWSVLRTPLESWRSLGWALHPSTTFVSWTL